MEVLDNERSFRSGLDSGPSFASDQLDRIVS